MSLAIKNLWENQSSWIAVERNESVKCIACNERRRIDLTEDKKFTTVHVYVGYKSDGSYVSKESFAWEVDAFIAQHKMCQHFIGMKK